MFFWLQSVNLPSIERGVGLYASTLPLFVDTKGEHDIKDWLGGIGKSLQAHAEHDGLALADIQKLIHREGNDPLFSSVVALAAHNSDLCFGSTNHNDIQIDSVDCQVPSHFELSLLVSVGEQVSLSLISQTDKLDETSNYAILNRYVEVLDLLSDSTCTSVPLLRQRWNLHGQQHYESGACGTLAPYQTIDDWIVDVASRQPSCLALVQGDRRITYADFVRKSRQLCRALEMNLGDHDRPVAICVSSGVDAIVAMIGVLLSGRCYLPLDPNQPLERQVQLCQDADCALVIVEQSINGTGWPKDSDLPPVVMTLDALYTQAKSNRDKVSHSVKHNEHSPAYLMYTSGSTGTPKGVLISHANLVYSTQARFDYYPNKVKQFLLVSPLHFDSSVVGLYWTLCCGGTIILPEQECRADLTHWGELVRKHQVSHVLCLPSVYRLWIGQCDAIDLQSLDSVIVAGEPCDKDLCESHYNKLPNAVLYNEYGPTEACVWSSVHRCRAHESDSVPIGQPIPGTSIKVIGVDNANCPDGVVGELHVFSRGVAIGYYNRPDLTAQSFSSDPPGYKTGDLGYYGRDGQLFCIGRLDRQIKIRGQRIEPAEIEAVIRRLNGSNEVYAFSAAQASAGEKRLWLAYSPRTLSVEQIRAAVRSQLPASMWPHGYLPLETLPTLSNGKVCESKLIALLPGVESEKHEEQPVIIKNEIISELLDRVNSITGGNKASINNGAMQCGLDSIDAMKLTAQLREKYDIDLRLVSVLQSGNWGELAAQIELLLNNSAKTIESTMAVAKEQLPLSSQQTSLWFLDQTGLHADVYAVQSTIRCIGKICIPAVEHALNALLHQHEILRTRLRADDAGNPCQVVLPPEPAEWTLIEHVGSDQTWKQVRKRQLSLRFDLSNDQLLRALVYSCSDEEHLLMFHSHHIAMDGWSFDVLHSQFIEYYDCYCRVLDNMSDTAGQTISVSMPEPDKYQYRHYARWQNNLTKQELHAETEHWCQILAEPREPLKLAYDFDRPKTRSFKGGSVARSIDPNIIECWAMLAQKTQSTPFMVALAAVKTGLRSMLGVSDLLIGTPVSNRVEPRWQKMLGFFGNTVVIRTKNHDNDTFVESVLQTRSATLDALQHENVPFDRIVRALGLQGVANKHPLFDVFFMYTHQYESLPALSNVNFELAKQAELTTAKFDLAVEIRPDNAGIEHGYELHLNYSADLFYPSTIEHLADSLLSVMSITADRYDNPIKQIVQPVIPDGSSTLPYVQADGSSKINSTNLVINQRIDQVFSTQCLNSPNSLALRHNGYSISYRELNLLVERIVVCLHQCGIEPGEVVAVSMPRSIHQIAAALAVSSCEAVWCPVDPEYPLARKQYMYSDSGTRFLITGRDHTFDQSSRMPLSHILSHIVVDPDENPVDLVPGVVSINETKPQMVDVSASQYRHENGVAVLMYTSGSTGNPKGVLLGHRAILNRFTWMWNRYPFANEDVNVIKTSCSFVDSLWECFGALLYGVPSVLVDDTDVTDIEHFVTVLRLNKVTRLLVVPSLLTSMLDWLTMYNQNLPDLKLCSCSGEVLPVHLAERLLTVQPSTRLLNLYGSTEVAADVTCQEVVLTQKVSKLSLGSVIDGITVHILDDQLREAVPGESGEIAFSGVGLAIGYHNDTVLTAQKFIENRNVGRLYLTGDTGYLDSFGRLHFNGRKDRLVKVRGVRINCHEIEQTINSLPGIAHSLVFAQGELDECQLCAVVQVNRDIDDSETINNAFLLNQLRDVLPVHQLPDRYQMVDALPQLSNGKPDRRAAAALIGECSESLQSFNQSSSNGVNRDVVNGDVLSHVKAASSDTDHHVHKNLLEPMLALWQEILKNDSVTVDDDFFEIGGYSLLAVKLVMRTNSEILAKHNLEMTIGDLLENRTVSQVVTQQAKSFTRSGSGFVNGSITTNKSLMTLQSGSSSHKLFMVPPFGDTGFFFNKFASCVPSDTSVFSFDMAFSVDHDSVQNVCSVLVNELLTVQPKGPWVIVAGCLGNVLAFEMAQQLKGRTGIDCDLYLIDSNPPREGPGWKHIRKKRRIGVNHYWSILRKEFMDDYCRKFIEFKVRKLRAEFDAGIRKYLEVRQSQSRQFVKYRSFAGSSNITFFRSSTFMKKSNIINRWSQLTTGSFKVYDFPDISHEKLVKAESPHWPRIVGVVLQSPYLQSNGIDNVTAKAGRSNMAQDQIDDDKADMKNISLNIN